MLLARAGEVRLPEMKDSIGWVTLESIGRWGGARWRAGLLPPTQSTTIGHHLPRHCLIFAVNHHLRFFVFGDVIPSILFCVFCLDLFRSECLYFLISSGILNLDLTTWPKHTQLHRVHPLNNEILLSDGVKIRKDNSFPWHILKNEKNLALTHKNERNDLSKKFKTSAFIRKILKREKSPRSNENRKLPDQLLSISVFSILHIIIPKRIPLSSAFLKRDDHNGGRMKQDYVIEVVVREAVVNGVTMIMAMTINR
ncbi:unnamed protein product [Lactuca saligna]|uniref:Uncharacterized protein n=1 Tax=Lactuca saligna TaxID=75948 RepID=A0AA35VD35_LACSI|nr:unnamed protein product [Lactuca saligna]